MQLHPTREPVLTLFQIGESTVEEEVRRRLEDEIRKERLQQITASINEDYSLRKDELDRSREKEFHSLYPSATDSMDVTIQRLKDDFNTRLKRRYDITNALKHLDMEYQGKKGRVRDADRNEDRSGYEAERRKLEESYANTRKGLELEVERLTTELSVYEVPYHSLVEAHDVRLRALERERASHLRTAQREAAESPFSRVEQKRILEELPIAVETELKEATRRELTLRVFQDFGHATRRDGQPQPAWEAVESRQCCLLLGQPGAGKTTFLKYVALRHLRSLTASPRLPIFVTLRDFASSECSDLLDYIAEGFADCGFPDATVFLTHLLSSNHKCLLLFDGLDEVALSEQEAVVQQIVRLSKRYRQNQFLVSCRTANYRGQLEGFTEFEIAEFGPEQVATFAAGWFRDSPQLANDFLMQIKKHPGLAELTATPLLLALLCIGYRRNQRFPDQKALIYLGSLDALLVDWDSSKQLRRETFVESFDSESKKQLLAKVACDTFCDETLFFTHSEIVDRLNENSNVLPIARGSGERILREYTENHGLLVERAKGIYSFSHLTFQEFLTALHLSRNQPLSVLERLADEAWKDSRWKETVVFLAGLLPRADVFAVCLRNRTKVGIAESKMKDLLLAGQLPEATEDYIRRAKTKGSGSAWIAWFRWRLFEYRLHEASYGTEFSGIAAQLGMMGISQLIAKALNLGQHLAHTLALDRPLNDAVAQSLVQLSSPARSDLLQAEARTIMSYLSMAHMLAEILSSGVRIDPSLRLSILSDLAEASYGLWEYPLLGGRNKLGA